MKKNVTKFRGSRTCGGGTHKNRRGGGSRGGRGNAGGCKHHFVRNYLKGITYGRHGFKRPQKVLSNKPIVNVGELDELAEQLVQYGEAHKQDDVYHINLAELEYPIVKVLGNGRITKPMVITVSEYSQKARYKIEKAGGSIEEYVPSVNKVEVAPKPEDTPEPEVEEVDDGLKTEDTPEPDVEEVDDGPKTEDIPEPGVEEVGDGLKTEDTLEPGVEEDI